MKLRIKRGCESDSSENFDCSDCFETLPPFSQSEGIFFIIQKNACKGSDFLGNKQINQLFYTKVCVNGKKVVPLRAFTKNTTLSV